MPRKMKPVEMEIHLRLLYLKRSMTPTSLPSSCWTSVGCSCKNSYSLMGSLPLILPISLSSLSVRWELFSIMYIGVSFRHSSRGTQAATNSTNRISMMVLQVRSDRKISAMVDSPTASPSCTPTPKRCLDLPRLCSLMKEKARVMAGLVPKPMKNSPNPTILGESASMVIATDIMPITHATRSAPFLPELSAILGITKKPMSAPKKSIDCRMGIWFQNQLQIMQSENQKAIERECDEISAFLWLGGRLQMYWRQDDSSEQSGLLQAKESSKKKAMPSSSHEVRNHRSTKTKKEMSWNFPQPFTRCSRRQTGDRVRPSFSGLAESSKDYALFYIAL